MNGFLAVDIGNSALKVGRFLVGTKPSVPLPQRVWEMRWARPAPAGGAANVDDGQTGPGIDDLAWHEFIGSLGAESCPWVVSSVQREHERRLASWVAVHRPADKYRRLSYRDAPLAMGVDFPERVGFDRVATAVAADRMRPAGIPAIVVDAGTALKVHAVTAQGTFAGGAILPGYHLAGRALAVETDLLPEVGVSSRDPVPVALGRNTEAAIRSGLFWGFVGAARELVARISGELDGQPVVFVSGGDAQGLVPYLGPQARFVPDMCLIGIAVIGQSMGRDRSVSEAVE